MHLLNIRRIGFVGLLLVFWVTGAFAEIDCRNYSKDTDSRCAYVRIEKGAGMYLFVVPEGENPNDMSAALKNEDFYVYAPASDNDTVKYSFYTTHDPIKNRQAVNSGAEGYVTVAVNAIYPIYNVPLGVATLENMSDAAIYRVYNFYAPAIKYCLDSECKKVVTDKEIAETKMEVGDTLTIYVRAVKPEGIDSTGKLESDLTQTFYINVDKGTDAENLIFLDMVGDPIDKQKDGYPLNIEGGKASFKLTSNKALTDGSTFALEGFSDGYEDDGTPIFVVSEDFPGGLRFDDHDTPTLDSAFVYDTDGDGAGDSIMVYMGGNLQYIDDETFFYNWPNDGKYKESTEFTKKGGKFSLNDVETAAAGDSAKGFVKATVHASNTNSSTDLDPVKIQDRIGPVIHAASIVDGDGAPDTLVVRFSKILDSAWTKGEGLVVNGKSIPAEAIVKKGDVWTFAVKDGLVKAGDSLQIATSCSKDGCPDGIISAADGNKAGKNNPVIVKNAGQLYAADENNAFFDINGDGRMDSATVAFKNPLSSEDLENLKVHLFWLDSDGEVKEIAMDNLDSLLKKGVMKLSEDKTIMGFSIDPDKYDIMKMLTSIDSSYSANGETYGFTTIYNEVTVDGKKKVKVDTLGMNDRIAPQISGTFLQPESFQKMEADGLVIEFSEAIDHENIKDLSDALLFSENGIDWKSLDVSSAKWSDDDKSVTIRLEMGVELDKRVNPADYVRFNENFAGFKDKAENGVFETPATVMLQGDPRVLATTTSLATLDFADLLSDKKDFSVRFVPADSSLDDEMKMSLGVLMNIGFSTIMKKDSAGSEILNLEDIGLSWEMYVYTNLGGYVASASGTIRCDDPYFKPEGAEAVDEGNCLEDPKKLYFRWNMRSENGRKVGIGVYLAKFKIKVFGAKETFEYERYYNWGVKAGKNGLNIKTLGK